MKWIEELERRKNPLSVKEAARIYGDSTGTFYKKIRRGEVPGAFREPGRQQGRIKICPAEFAAWLRKRVEVGCRSATAKANALTKPMSLSVERDMHSQNVSEEDSAGKRLEKEVPRLVG